MVSYCVAQRTHEIGVRLALGARPAQVRLLVLVSGLVPAAVGLAAGLTGALALGNVLDSVAFGVTPRDPSVLATVAGLLSAIVVLAAWIPARQATRVDPLQSMRRG